jgi:hypothetical protein
VLELAIETRIAPQYWEALDARSITTALDILTKRSSNATPGARGLGARGPISG